jgi:hypothetical protein
MLKRVRFACFLIFPSKSLPSLVTSHILSPTRAIPSKSPLMVGCPKAKERMIAPVSMSTS